MAVAVRPRYEQTRPPSVYCSRNGLCVCVFVRRRPLWMRTKRGWEGTSCAEGMSRSRGRGSGSKLFSRLAGGGKYRFADLQIDRTLPCSLAWASKQQHGALSPADPSLPYPHPIPTSPHASIIISSPSRTEEKKKKKTEKERNRRHDISSSSSSVKKRVASCAHTEMASTQGLAVSSVSRRKD